MKGYTVSTFLLIHAILFVIGSLLLLHRTNQLHQQYEYETARMNILQARCEPEVSDEQVMVVGSNGGQFMFVGELASKEVREVLDDFLQDRPHYAVQIQNRQKRQLSMHGMIEELLRLQEVVLETHCQNNSTICERGHKGTPGPKGFTGITGSRGNLGDVGPQGQTGHQGVKGQQGAPGQIGATGSIGAPGIDGAQGPQGPKGDSGDIGVVGVKGNTGQVGLKGHSGEKGTPGIGGDAGIQGQNGADGLVGDPGARGSQGQKGEPGLAGPPGIIIDRNCICKGNSASTTNRPVATGTTTPTAGTSITGTVVHVRSLDPVTLTCLTSPSPDQTITWERIGVPMSARYDVTTNTNTLTIPEAYAYDTGRYRCTATSKTGSNIQATISLKVDDVTQYDCSFEVGTCNWKQSTTDDLDWIRHSGPTDSVSTGPNTDHTVGREKEGYYMYLETSSYIAGHKADLVSPVVDHTKSYCVNFWYNMYGIQVADLQLLAKENGGTESLLWTRTGDQGGGWRSVRFEVALRNLDYNLILRATQGHGYHGDIAIDDLTVREGNCVM